MDDGAHSHRHNRQHHILGVQPYSFRPDYSNEPTPEFVNLELAQALETYRAMFSLAVQLMSVFIIADVTVVGYAISVQIAGILFAGTILPLAIYYVVYGATRRMNPVIYSAIIMEQTHGGAQVDWLATTFFASIVSPGVIKHFQLISKLESFDERIEKLREVKGSTLGGRRLLLLLSAIAGAHVVLPFALSTLFGWRLLWAAA